LSCVDGKGFGGDGWRAQFARAQPLLSSDHHYIMGDLLMEGGVCSLQNQWRGARSCPPQLCCFINWLSYQCRMRYRVGPTQPAHLCMQLVPLVVRFACCEFLRRLHQRSSKMWPRGFDRPMPRTIRNSGIDNLLMQNEGVQSGHITSNPFTGPFRGRVAGIDFSVDQGVITGALHTRSTRLLPSDGLMPPP
jgi:hypothetical protein